MTDQKKKIDREIEVLKEDYYFHCSKHDIPYPKGSSCPACDAEIIAEKINHNVNNESS